MIFEYWGISAATHQTVHNYIDLPSEGDVYRWFRDNGIHPTRDIRAYRGSLSTKSRLSTGELIDFFSALEFNGTYNVAKALDGFASHCQNQRFARVAREMAAMCRDNRTLAAAAARFPRYYPQWIINFLSAGDTSGTMQASISQILGVLHADEENGDALADGMRKIRNVALLGCGLLLLYIYVFLPTVKASILSLREPITGLTAFVFAVVDLFHNPIFVGIAIVGLVAARLLLPPFLATPPVRRAIERAMLAIPACRTVIVSDQTARVARMLGKIIPSGLSLPQAFQMAASIVTISVIQDEMVTAFARASKSATLVSIFDGLEHFDYRFLLRLEASKNAPLRPTVDATGTKIPSQADACIESADYLSRLTRRILNSLIEHTTMWVLVAIMVILVGVSILAFVPYFAIVKRLLLGF